MIRRFSYPFFETPGDKGGSTGVMDKGAIKPERADDDTGLMDSLIGDKDLLDMDEQEGKGKKDKEEVIDEEQDLLEEQPETEVEVPGEEESEVENARGLDLAKIKEKYPDFAKTNEFRELRNAYFRESKYTELFPTIEDAKEAAENNETFNKLNMDLVERGDPTSLLTSIKDANPEAYKRVATTFLDTIAKTDNAMYVEVVTPVVRRLAKQIYNEGNKILKRNADSDDGKALVATARNIMQYAFDDANEIEKDEPRVDNKLTEKERELAQREQNIKIEKFGSAYKICESSVEKNLEKAIVQGLDPDGRFNDFTRDTLVEKIRNEVKGQIEKDSLHIRRMTSLWKRAEAEGYSRESLSRIVSAYLERARPIIPNVRNKFRTIAIKGRQAEATDSGEENNNRSPRIANRGRSGRAPENDGRVNVKRADPKKIDYSKTTDDDIFEGRVKLRG